MHLCLIVECIASGLHFVCFYFGLTPRLVEVLGVFSGFFCEC